MRLPATRAIGVTQDRTASPSTITVHAPHCAIPQPNLVPVSPNVSRSTHNKGVRGSSDVFSDLPLIMSCIAMRDLQGCFAYQRQADPGPEPPHICKLYEQHPGWFRIAGESQRAGVNWCGVYVLYQAT